MWDWTGSTPEPGVRGHEGLADGVLAIQLGRFDDPLELVQIVPHAPLEELRR